MIEIIKLTLKEAKREKGFYAGLILLFLSLICYFIVESFAMFEPEKVMAVYALSSVEGLTIILLFFLIFSFLSQDLNKKGIEYMLTLPIKRRDYILGRFFGINISVFILAIISTFIYMLLHLLMFGVCPFAFLIQLILLMALVLMLSSLPFLLITASKRPTLIAFLVFFIYVIGINLDDAVRFLSTRHGREIPVVSRALLKISYYIFPNFSFFDVKIPIAYKLSFSTMHIIFALLYGILYTFFILLFSIMLFQNKEIK